MIKVLLLILVSFTIRFGASAQTGFYLIIENINACPHQVADFDGIKKYCIPEKPIVQRTDFKVEGYLQYSLDMKEQFFTIRFNKGSYETLKMIHDGMPNNKVLLVVDNKAMGVYDGKALDPTELMHIMGKAGSKEIRWIFNNMKKD